MPVTSSTRAIEKHIVSDGDYGFATPGPLFVRTKNRLNYNVSAGQPVVYKHENGIATIIDPLLITSSDLNKIFIGVGHSSAGNGVVDGIRHIGIDGTRPCYIDQMSVSSPQCGQPQVIDFFFDCPKEGETYSVIVEVDDNRSRSYSPFNKDPQYVGTMTLNTDTGCEDCPTTPDCGKIACELADALNGDVEFKIGDQLYPDWKSNTKYGGSYRPFFATQLHDRSLVYCLSASDPADGCEECTDFTAITSIVVGGVTIQLAGTTDPSNSAVTLRAQLQSVVDQINAAFEADGNHVGTAFLSGGGYSKCCPLELHVNTCDDTFAITGLTATETNPFTENGTITKNTDCEGCDPVAATTSLTCGIRVIAHPIVGDCDCFLEKPKQTYLRKMKVIPFGEGWKWGQWKVTEVQSAVFPAGFGSETQFLELRHNEPEGKARRFNRSNVNKGWLGLPEEQARVRGGVTAKCEKDYCRYRFKSVQPKRTISREYSELEVYSTIHIPYDDTNTISAWEAFMATLAPLVPSCPGIEAVTCTPLDNGCS